MFLCQTLSFSFLPLPQEGIRRVLGTLQNCTCELDISPSNPPVFLPRETSGMLSIVKGQRGHLTCPKSQSELGWGGARTGSSHWLPLCRVKGTWAVSLQVRGSPALPLFGPLKQNLWKHRFCGCSVTKLCLTFCAPMDCHMPGFPVPHHLPEFAHTHGHWVGGAIQPSHLLSPFSSCPQCFPASGSFPVCLLFTSGGPSITASAPVLPMNIQDWFPLGWTGWISLQSKGLSRVFSSTSTHSGSPLAPRHPRSTKSKSLTSAAGEFSFYQAPRGGWHSFKF